MNAISGTRRQVRELVDGTLEVKIHVEPRHKAEFHRLFAEIDMPVAIAPLVPEYQQAKPGLDPYPERAPSSWSKLGPLCQSAVGLCHDNEFQQFAIEALHMNPDEIGNREEFAADYVRSCCAVSSRKEIDGGEPARLFRRMIEEYRAWRGDRDGDTRAGVVP